jgi:hypothetical protein
MVSMLASSGVDRVFKSRSDQTKDYKIGICCFSVRYAALRRKRQRLVGSESKNVPEWSDMSTRGLLFQ